MAEPRVPLLTIRGLSILGRSDQGIVPILENIDLDLARGEVLGLIGESGAGKSTLAQRFAGQFLHDDVSLLVRTPGWQVWRQSAYRAPQGELAWQVPIAAVYCLESDRTCTRADRIAPAEACARVAMQTIFVGGAAAPAMAAALAALTQDVPVFGLSHALTDSVATVLRVFRNAAGARQDG